MKSVSNVVLIYFSPTGGTEQVVRCLAQAWTDSPEEVDLSRPVTHTCAQSDLCILGVPSYGGRVPQIALERLAGVQGNGARAVLVAVYGNRAYEDTLLEWKEAAEQQGFLCVGAVAAVAEHSIMRQFASGRPDEEDRQELLSYGEKIKEFLETSGPVSPLQVPGNRPYREYGGVPIKPKTSAKQCTGCKICANACPVGAIPVTDPTVTDADRCISCMRCIQVCPTQARKCSSVLLFATAKKLQKVCQERKRNQLFLPEQAV